MNRLEGKIAVVTGSARGIGRAIVEKLAAHGAKMVISCDMGESSYEQGNVVHKILNVTDREAIKTFVDEIEKEYGKIDILVNNASISIQDDTENISYEEWLKEINLSLNGAFSVAQTVGRQRIEKGSGSIINVSSVLGLIANKTQDQSSYETSKAGVTMLTKSLAREWSRYGIKVNAIAPGYMRTIETEKILNDNTETNTTPMERVGEPEELAGITVYLASDASSFTQGSVFNIDGGYSAL